MRFNTRAALQLEKVIKHNTFHFMNFTRLGKIFILRDHRQNVVFGLTFGIENLSLFIWYIV